jgi:hypothetical protein
MTLLLSSANRFDEGTDACRQRLRDAMGAQEAGEIEPLRVAIEEATAKGLPEDELQPASQLLQELEALRQPLTFADVPRPEMEELQSAVSREKAMAILSRCLGFSEDEGFQAMILAELHYHNFAFCQRSGFSAEKTSTLISIFKAVHTKAIVEDGQPMSAARSLFEALVDRHSQQLPPYRIGVFSREEASLVKAYADRTFFRHYKMYAFAYLQRQELIVRSAFEHVAPPVPPAVKFKESHEVDPKLVPELEDLFMDTATASLRGEEAFSAATVPILEQSLRPQCSANPFADEHDAHVAAAIDEAMQEHLAGLDPRIAAHPLATN